MPKKCHVLFEWFLTQKCLSLLFCKTMQCKSVSCVKLNKQPTNQWKMNFHFLNTKKANSYLSCYIGNFNVKKDDLLNLKQKTPGGRPAILHLTQPNKILNPSRSQFHQYDYAQPLQAQIPKGLKDSQVICVFFSVWGSSHIKALQKRWWNRPQTSLTLMTLPRAWSKLFENDRSNLLTSAYLGSNSGQNVHWSKLTCQ